jgi:lysyl-tRNA synthetase class 2
MLLTNQPSIQDVLLFPQMRPEQWEVEGGSSEDKQA